VSKTPFEWGMEAYLRTVALVMMLQVMMALLNQFYYYSPMFMSGFMSMAGPFGPFMSNMLGMIMFMPMLMVMQMIPLFFRGFYW